jgi:hypothetical protein
VRSHGHQLKTLVRLNGDVKATLTVSLIFLWAKKLVLKAKQTDHARRFGKYGCYGHEGEKTPESTYHSFRSIFAHFTALNPFF